MLKRITLAGVLAAAVAVPVVAQAARCDAMYAEQSRGTAVVGVTDALALARRDDQIGEICESSGMYAPAEVALQRAIELFPAGAVAERLAAENDLATLLARMGDSAKAESEDRKVLAEAERSGEAGAASLAWTNLADVEAMHRHFAKAIEYSRRAVELTRSSAPLPVIDRLLAKQALGFALAGAHQCEEAIPVLQEVVLQSKSSYGEQSGEAAINQFVLGRAVWQCGASEDGMAWMQQGVLGMKGTLGAGHIGYLHALSEYAQFLHENGRLDEAAKVERELRMADATVDARSLMATASLR